MGARDEFLCLANWSISSIRTFSSSSLTGSINDKDLLKEGLIKFMNLNEVIFFIDTYILGRSEEPSIDLFWDV